MKDAWRVNTFLVKWKDAIFEKKKIIFKTIAIQVEIDFFQSIDRCHFSKCMMHRNKSLNTEWTQNAIRRINNNNKS